jgi:Ca-activated chloride channel homolog
MTFLAPLALVALLVGPLIYLIHFLRGSRREVRVPALFLWTDLTPTPSGRHRRRWPPLSLLLILQVAAASLAALALARPATLGDPARHVALVLDASGSMQATDVPPNRFAAARSKAFERLGGLSDRDRVSLVLAGPTPSLLASGTPDKVRGALATAQVGAGAAAIREALALAAAQVAATPDRQGQIVVLTDGAWPPLAPIGALQSRVEFVGIGGGAENQAVSSLQVRLDPSGRGQTAFVEVSNQADHGVRAPLRLLADGAVLDERQVDVPARGRTRVAIPLPVDAQRIGVRLLGQDALAADDVAETTTPGGLPHDVVLISRGPSPGGSAETPLRRALEALPFVRVKAAVQGSQTPGDLVVVDGPIPAELPSAPLLLVNPSTSDPRMNGRGGATSRPIVAHPLLDGVDVGALRGLSATLAGPPAWASVVFANQTGPLVVEGRLEGRRAVAFTFDPVASGMDKSLSFPLLVSDASTYLLSQAAASSQAEPFDPAESDIRPRPFPSLGDAEVGRPVGGSASVDRWPWLAAAVLGLLGVEWLVFARRD